MQLEHLEAQLADTGWGHVAFERGPNTDSEPKLAVTLLDGDKLLLATAGFSDDDGAWVQVRRFRVEADQSLTPVPLIARPADVAATIDNSILMAGDGPVRLW